MQDSPFPSELPYDPHALAELLAERVRALTADAALRARLREDGFATAARFTRARFVEGVVAAHERHSPR